MTPRSLRICSLILTACAVRSAFAAAPPSAEQVEFFEKQVRPVLVERCYECHSAEKKTKGGLALDTREATLKGGDNGPVVVAGDPEKSLLIEAVRYTNHDMQMPPKKRLADAEIKALEDWVKMGAPDPRESAAVAKNAKGHRHRRRAQVLEFQAACAHGAAERSAARVADRWFHRNEARGERAEARAAGG